MPELVQKGGQEGQEQQISPGGVDGELMQAFELVQEVGQEGGSEVEADDKQKKLRHIAKSTFFFIINSLKIAKEISIFKT